MNIHGSWLSPKCWVKFNTIPDGNFTSLFHSLPLLSVLSCVSCYCRFSFTGTHTLLAHAEWNRVSCYYQLLLLIMILTALKNHYVSVLKCLVILLSCTRLEHQFNENKLTENYFSYPMVLRNVVLLSWDVSYELTNHWRLDE